MELDNISIGMMNLAKEKPEGEKHAHPSTRKIDNKRGAPGQGRALERSFP
jgi:hypothetical protein